tara:strand:+ start:12569 stop:13279 length:711 start_codon:yes stop_codon:yes gene_type:complete
MPRLWEIDFFRGIAIIMMIVFHFFWNLTYFEIIKVSLYTGFLGAFQTATASLFLFLVGLSLTLLFNKHKGYTRPIYLNAGKILTAALGISFVTFILFPQSYIYFGILHLIGISMLISIPVIKQKYASLILGTAFILAPLFFRFSSLEIFPLLWLGLAKPVQTIDFYPIIPWFGIILLGIFAGNYFYENGTARFKIQKPKLNGINFVEYLGKNSLAIYLTHQLVMFPLAYLVSLLIL